MDCPYKKTSANKINAMDILEDIAETFRNDPEYEDWIWACNFAVDCILKDKGANDE